MDVIGITMQNVSFDFGFKMGELQTQRLKPLLCYDAVSARLKACPDTNLCCMTASAAKAASLL
jgi:hypothetical protein